MSIENRLTGLEKRSGADEPLREVVVLLPETLSREAWTQAAREQASGKAVSLPMREIRFTRGRKND